MMSAPPMESAVAAPPGYPLADRRLSLSRREASQRHIEARRRNCLLKQLTQGDADAELNAGCSNNRSGALRLVMPGRAGKAQARLVGPAPWLPRRAGALPPHEHSPRRRCRARNELAKPASSSRFNEGIWWSAPPLRSSSSDGLCCPQNRSDCLPVFRSRGNGGAGPRSASPPPRSGTPSGRRGQRQRPRARRRAPASRLKVIGQRRKTCRATSPSSSLSP